MRVRTQHGGAGEPVLLLLHGLGATGDVWRGLTDELAGWWPGRWVAPDLPGHGGSDPLPSYSFGHLAAAVTAAVGPAERVVVLGHSLGGVLALTLGTGWFGLPVTAACGLGIKVSWTDDELARAQALAARPMTWFDSRDEAAARYLKVSGLAGLLDPGSAAVDVGLVEDGGRWRLALDPAAFGVGAPDLSGLLAASRATVRLAAGEHDPMCTPEQLRALDADAVILSGLGHNAHVEDPAALRPLIS